MNNARQEEQQQHQQKQQNQPLLILNQNNSLQGKVNKLIINSKQNTLYPMSKHQKMIHINKLKRLKFQLHMCHWSHMHIPYKSKKYNQL